MALYKNKYLSSENLYPLLGRSIKQLRQQRELTQEELAELVNIDQKQISYIESGKARARLPTYLRIANIFDVSIDHLLAAALIIEPNQRLPELLSGESEQEFLQEVIRAAIHYLNNKKT